MSRIEEYFQKAFQSRDEVDEMTVFAVDVWHTVLAELRSNGLKTAARTHILERYVLARTEFQFLYPVAMKDGPTRTSDGGGEYASMPWAAVRRLSDQISKFEDALMISPKAAGAEIVPEAPVKPWSPADEFLD